MLLTSPAVVTTADDPTHLTFQCTVQTRCSSSRTHLGSQLVLVVDELPFDRPISTEPFVLMSRITVPKGGRPTEQSTLSEAQSTNSAPSPAAAAGMPSSSSSSLALVPAFYVNQTPPALAPQAIPSPTVFVYTRPTVAVWQVNIRLNTRLRNLFISSWHSVLSCSPLASAVIKQQYAESSDGETMFDVTAARSEAEMFEIERLKCNYTTNIIPNPIGLNLVTTGLISAMTKYTY